MEAAQVSPKLQDIGVKHTPEGGSNDCLPELKFLFPFFRTVLLLVIVCAVIDALVYAVMLLFSMLLGMPLMLLML